MKYVRLGSSNLKVSSLCFGAMGLGSRSWRGWVLEGDEGRPVLRRALDHGINFFDTCDFYSSGESERLVKKLLLDEVRRDEVVIATKVGNPMQAHPNGRGFSRKHIMEAVDASLTRLGTDYIDLYQTHVWDADTDLDELIDSFDDLVRSGKVRYVGAATMPAWSFCTALHKALGRHRHRFISMQCEYNPCHREAERELLPLCRAETVGVIPFSPMARGFLSADRRDQATWDARTRTDDYTQKYYYRPGDFAVYDAVAAVAKARGVSTSQVALAWTAGRPGVTAPVFGATSPEQVDEAVAALTLVLERDELAAIAAAYQPRDIDKSGH